jgi:hypothetical protein
MTDALFSELRGLLARHAKHLAITTDAAEHYYANCSTPDAKGKPVFFGAVKQSGKKTLFHLMPVYVHPEMLDAISPALKKQMQGKSCFNFQAHDAALIKELKALVDEGVKRFKQDGKL